MFASTCITTLSTTNLPNITYIPSNAFAKCSSLLTVDLPNITTISSGAFANCSKVTSISIPNCTTIEDYAFNSCTELTSITVLNDSLTLCEFCYCSSLSYVAAPNCTYIANSVFYSCPALGILDFTGVQSIPQLTSTNAFVITPISGSSYLGRFGSIYVPASLYSDWITTTNWTVYSSRITSEPIPVL